MEQQPSLMQRAQQMGAQQAPAPEPESDQADQGGEFKRPDIEPFIPDEAKDAVGRVVAAGMKLIYSPQMRDEVQQEMQGEAPVPEKLANAVTGLMLTLDSQSRGGIPMPAIFPAAMELLGEAAEILSASGEQVTQSDYNDAAQRMFVLIGQKLGANEQQMMGAAEQALGGQGGENEPGEGPAHEGAESPDMERTEDANPGAEPDEEQ